MCLPNPEILWLDERGIVIYRIERLGRIDGPPTSYWQYMAGCFLESSVGVAFLTRPSLIEPRDGKYL